jgi:hypothetical protein
MIVKYGSYQHSQNEVSMRITREPMRSQAGVFYAYKERWDCQGLLLNYSTQAAITTAIQQLTSAYSVDGNDLVLYLDDGVTPTAHALYNANCNGGTRIVQAPSFPETLGTAEYQPAAGRSYSFAVEGETALTSENVVTKFEETLKFQGTGGPIVVWIPVAQGPWIQQQTSEASTYKVVQSGSAIGLYGTPPVPPPIWPDAEIVQERQIQMSSPQRYGELDFPVSWSYTFEAIGQLTGQPNVD